MVNLHPLSDWRNKTVLALCLVLVYLALDAVSGGTVFRTIVRVVIGYDNSVLRPSRNDERPHSQLVAKDEGCKLGPAVPVIMLNVTSPPNTAPLDCSEPLPWQHILQLKCTWTPVLNSDGSCRFELSGRCIRKEIDGCEFFGFPDGPGTYMGLRRIPAHVMPVGRAPGEMELSASQESVVLAPFQECQNRAAYWLLDRVAGCGRVPPYSPLPILMGGPGNTQQDVYFVEFEVIGSRYKLNQIPIETGGIVVDIGANVGLFSISVCKRLPNVTIWSFEPHPINFRFLIENVKKSGCSNRVHAFNSGVSKDGRHMDMSFAGSIHGNSYGPRDPSSTFAIRTIAVQDLWSSRYFGGETIPNLVKVDCEGCEYEVLPLIQPSQYKRLECEAHPHLFGDVGPPVNPEVREGVEKLCAKR